MRNCRKCKKLEVRMEELTDIIEEVQPYIIAIRLLADLVTADEAEVLEDRLGDVCKHGGGK